MGEKFGDLLAGEDAVKSKVRGALEGRLTSVLFVVCLLCSAALSLVETGIVNPLSPELLVNFANRFLTSYITYILFISPGEADELARDEKHKGVREMLDELSERVYHGGLLSRFYAFCTEKEQTNLAKRRRRIYSRFLDEARYRELAALTRVQLKNLEQEGKITEAQYRAVRQAARQKVKPIKPAYVLAACAEDDTEDAVTSMASYVKKCVLSKPVTFAMMSLAVNSITFAWTETTVFEAVVGIATSAMIIFFSALSGYRVGRTATIRETAQRQHRIRFLREFDEWRGQEQSKDATIPA